MVTQTCYEYNASYDALSDTVQTMVDRAFCALAGTCISGAFHMRGGGGCGAPVAVRRRVQCGAPAAGELMLSEL